MSEKEKNISNCFQTQILLQLHEQYAINNNSSMGAIISLLVSMFAAIGAYGYIWVNCKIDNSSQFNIADLSFSAIGASFILLIMTYICMYQGTSQRLEQFIAQKIREQSEIANFFPKTYNPYCKKGIDVVQGLYGEFVKIFLFVLLFIQVSFLIKLCEFHEYHCFSLIGVFVVFLVYLILTTLFLFQNVQRYQKRNQICSGRNSEEVCLYDKTKNCKPFDCCVMNVMYRLYEFVCDTFEKCKCVQN